MAGIEAIAAERKRQIEGEGFTPDHDQNHKPQDFIDAARCYLGAAQYAVALRSEMPTWARDGMAPWPWDESWWKPSPEPGPNLVKAGALVAAALDRLEDHGR